MELTTVKTILRITSTQYDEYLTAMIPRAKFYAESYCHRTFDDPLPLDVETFIAKYCEYNMIQQGLQSKTMGEVSYTFDIEERVPRTLLAYLKPYRKLAF